MTPLQAAARAAYEAYPHIGFPTWDDLPSAVQREYIRSQRAAFAAVRVPSEEACGSVAAVLEHPTVRPGGPSPMAMRQAARLYTAAIDALLAEGE